MSKEKKKMSKGAKITLITVCSVLGVALIAVIAFLLSVLIVPKQPPTVVSAKPLNIQMYDTVEGTKDAPQYKHYFGNEGIVDLAIAFPNGKNFVADGFDIVDNKVDGADLTPGATKIGTLTFDETTKDKDGKDVTTSKTVNIYCVKALNVQGENMEDTMKHALYGNENEGIKPKSVVMQQNLKTKGKQSFVIKSKGINVTTLYGNGYTIDANSICAPKNQNKNRDNSWGAHVIKLDGESMNVQDIHIFGNSRKGDTVTLENFEFSGNGIDIDATPMSNGQYRESKLTNCIVENAQKLLHIHGAKVLIDGCTFRNGADANIASGTCEKLGSYITIRNSASISSMVTGFLFYGYENINSKSQQTLNIEGFFDVYNWKTTTSTKLVPATENIGALKVADVVNGNVQKEVGKAVFAPYLYAIKDVKYVHIAIVKLATGSCTKQAPTMLYNGKPGLPPQYAAKSFPLPGWVNSLGIVKSVGMYAIKNKADLKGEKPNIMPGVDAALVSTLYSDLAYGRPSDPVPSK